MQSLISLKNICLINVYQVNYYLINQINILNTYLILIYQINNNVINIISSLLLIKLDHELIMIINTYFSFTNEALQSAIKLTTILSTLFHLY